MYYSFGVNNDDTEHLVKWLDYNFGDLKKITTESSILVYKYYGTIAFNYQLESNYLLCDISTVLAFIKGYFNIVIGYTKEIDSLIEIIFNKYYNVKVLNNCKIRYSHIS
jgi:hypothetical protein